MTMRGRRSVVSKTSYNGRRKRTCFSTSVRILLICIIVTLLIVIISASGILSFTFDSNENSTVMKILYSDWIERLKIAINFRQSSSIIDLSSEGTLFKRDSGDIATDTFSVSSDKNYAPVPVALIEARKVLDKHPLYRLTLDRPLESYTLEDVMLYLQNQPQCKNKPIFTSMAQVGSDLYWQLIENFIYTMVKFNLIDCSIMICVTDQVCMNLCEKSGFPCYYYDHLQHNPGIKLPSALEQIANLKLLHLPKALRKGVRFRL